VRPVHISSWHIDVDPQGAMEQRIGVALQAVDASTSESLSRTYIIPDSLAYEPIIKGLGAALLIKSAIFPHPAQ